MFPPRFSRSVSILLICLAFAVFITTPARSTGVGISMAADTLAPAQRTDLLFYRYRVKPNISLIARRDLEFLWSSTYVTRNQKPIDPNDANENDLDRLGEAVCVERGKNPFGFNVPDIELVYNYLNFADTLYNGTDANTPGFLVPQPSYPQDDRSHIDYYLYYPDSANVAGDDSDLHGRGATNSDFLSPNEDVSTGHDSTTCQPPTCPNGPLIKNSVSGPGPLASQVWDVSATRWTRPDAQANWVFDHEFQHCFNNAAPNPVVTEIFSSAAEALGGETPAKPLADTPFSWSLLSKNYQAWRTFTAYLAYNYRGTDTSAAVMSDDLVWRWAHGGGSHGLPELGLRLQDSECGECDAAHRPYFVGLSAHERLQLLVHQWRVANYINNPWIEQRQFGYPGQFRFSPDTTIGYWQDIDTSPQAINSIVVPYDQLAVPQWRYHGVSLTRRPTTPDTRRLGLTMFGSEYFIIHAWPGVTNDTLVVSVAPESLVRDIEGCYSQPRDGRLYVSIVKYLFDADSLFRHPTWARAVETQTVTVDSMRGPLTFVIPRFGRETGDSVRAVLVVASLEDGPHALYSSTTLDHDFLYLPLRVSAYLRKSPYLTPNPQPLSQSAGDVEDHPSWAPSGNEVAFNGVIHSISSFAQIYRKGLGGGPPTRLVTSPVQSENQYGPDWSPRGEYIAYYQNNGPAQSEIWASDLAGHPSRLTNHSGAAIAPAYSPNGEQIAYFLQPGYGYPWELRKMSATGENDVKLASLWGLFGTSGLRWSPDGKFLFFTSFDTLYQVSSNGGTVYRRDALGFDVESFDLNRGVGELAIAQRYDPLVTYFCAGQQPLVMPVRRLVVRDTLVTPALDNTRAQFYRTGVTFDNPRWSYDGTKIAYSADPNNTGDRDLFFGEVTNDHPPHFTGGTDGQSVDACDPVPFHLDLSASDPDGETVTFGAAMLPTGASFSGNRLTWVHPQVGEYWIAFRAMDGSGGSDHAVVYFNVYEGNCFNGFAGGGGGGGGSLMARPYDGDVATIDANAEGQNSLFDGAATGQSVWDALRMPDPGTGLGYSAWLRAGSGQGAALDGMLVQVVDHSVDVRAYLLGKQAVLGTRLATTEARLGDGTNVTAPLSGTAVEPLLATAGSSIALTLPGEGSPLVVESRSSWAPDPLSPCRISVQVPDGAGWSEVGHIYPRRGYDEAAVDCGSATQVRLVFSSDAELRFAGSLSRSKEIPAVRWATLSDARDAKLGDVKASVNADDGTTAAVSGPDTVLASFTMPSLSVGQSRDCFLWVHATLQASQAIVASNYQSTAGSTPPQFALFQNQPNPFGTRTAIRFALPRASAVRLEIFDVLGRRVKVLTDHGFPPGEFGVEWDGRDEGGNAVRPGIYLYRIQAEEFADRKRMVLLP